MYSHYCDSKIETIEDIGTCAVEVRLVKTDWFSKPVMGFGSLCTCDNVPRSISTDDRVCTTRA